VVSPLLYSRRLELLDAKLSARERAVISVLLEMRFLSTRQLERWVFDGATPLARARAARRGIAKLVTLGIVRHLERRIGGVRAGSAGHINVLTPLGLRLAAVYGWITPEQVRRTREPGGQFVRHYLAVAEAHLVAIEAQERNALELLERQAEPAAWRTFTGPTGNRTILKPDGFFAVGSGQWAAHWFLEVDRSTASGATLDRKLATYVAYWRSGQEVAARGVHPRTLWLAPDSRRVAQLQRAFARTPADARVLFVAAPFDELLAALTDKK
jgi:hypothetical protein